ncbi:MAG: NrfD/PsrC family molybdoenzyme membrane anchor subunit [Chthonomonadales bacterium]
MEIIKQDRLITGRHTNATITERITRVILDNKAHPLSWYVVIGSAFMVLQVLMLTITLLLYIGVGIFGINQPCGWGLDIINFVWWIGIGHAGTLISAILLLMRQQWRTSINRFAEAMTIFAVMCAGLYPLLHTGRPWVAYWLFPYPNILKQWPQFRSPLVWDVFAVSTYATVSILFWFVGLIPDLATMRDRAKPKWAKMIFGMASLGWRGSTGHWFRYETAYLILAGLSTPLVLSVHTIVSFDFAVGIVPGWHTTIFPPYFVAGAVFAGFAMVMLLAIPIRSMYGLKDFITLKHLDWMAKITLTTGMMVFYGYLTEVFYGWYSGNPFEWYVIINRFKGPYAPFYWSLIACNGLAPLVLWSPRIRRNVPALFIVSIIVSIGMWLERFVIIPASLHRDFMPSAWGLYTPSVGDMGMFIGTLGMFVFMMFLFVRFVPMISIAEMKELLHREYGHGHGAGQGEEHQAEAVGAGKH